MFALDVNRFGLTISSVAIGAQPALATGTAVTPGNLTYGSYAQLLTATSDDSCEVEVGISNAAVSGAARDALVDIGWDPAGGTNYGAISLTMISQLLASCAAAYVGGANGVAGGVVYRFPLRIPAGSTVAARAMVNSATVTTFGVYVKLRCRPSRPDLIWVGSYVDSYGITLASASGTAITPGTAARSAYVSLGTLAQTYSYFESGLGINNATMATQGYEVDVAVGDVTNKDIVIESAVYTSSVAETIAKQAGNGRYARTAAGQTLFARAQASAAPTAGISVAAYAVGG